MRRLIVLAVCLTMSVLPASAAKPVQPSSELTPENVISIQLKALSEVENDPTTNSGVAQVWAFAHPSNRLMTGPLRRFTLMLQSPRYRALIGHRSHYLRLVSEAPRKAHFAIRVTARDGTVYGYSWHLAKVANGAYENMWMTTTVALVGKLGQQL